MRQVWLVLAIASMTSPALAQGKADEEPSSYKGLSAAELRTTYCIYNDKLFTKGAEICVRKGAALKCEGGAWSAAANVCQTAPDAHPAF